jgi:hypothetical protein
VRDGQVGLRMADGATVEQNGVSFQNVRENVRRISAGGAP